MTGKKVPAARDRVRADNRTGISKHKVDESPSQENEFLFRHLFESMSLGVISYNSQGKVISANPSAQRMLGHTEEEMCGNGFFLPDWVIYRHDGSDLPLEEHPVAQAMRTARPVEQYVLCLENPSLKTKTWLSGCTIPLPRPGENTPSLVYTFFEDITRRKKAEEQLQAAHDELERRVLERTNELLALNTELKKASQVKDEFLAIMSHELFTPLSGILGLAQILQQKSYGELSEEQFHAIQLIENSGQRLNKLVRIIMDYTKLQSGKSKLLLQQLELGGLCRTHLPSLEKFALENKLKLHFFIEPDEIIARVDGLRFGQIIAQLLSNAIRFTPAGGQILLSVTGDLHNGRIQIRVEDSGIGIREADLPRLFQPFTQLDMSLTRNFEGAGMGLAMVKLLAELHDGKVQVTSEPGKGSCFIVSLPWAHG